MKLKKINAALGLMSIFFMLLHIAYSVFAYLTMYYNPFLKNLFAIPFIILVCLHAVLGMVSVSLSKDAKSLDMYPKLNLRTVLQRVSASLIFPLLILHLNTFSLMKTSAEVGKRIFIFLLIIAELLFFGVVITHIAVSFTNGFITLGLLSSRKKQLVIDKILYIIGAIAFLLSSFAVVRGQIMMFLQ